jgi:hypothetical protein
LPAIAWLLFALVINSIVIPPILSFSYWGRWIGLFILTIFGFWQLFLPGKWQRNKFDRYAIPVLTLIAMSTVFADSDSVLHASKFYETGVFKAFSILLTYPWEMVWSSKTQNSPSRLDIMIPLCPFQPVSSSLTTTRIPGINSGVGKAGVCLTSSLGACLFPSSE